MRIVLCFLLAMVAAPAWAEWMKVSEDGNGVAYIEPTTIRKTGEFRKVWVLIDLKQKTSNGSLSMRGLWEFDCKEERNRVFSLSTHSGQMAGGIALTSGSTAPGDWSDTPPNTSARAILTRVCYKK